MTFVYEKISDEDRKKYNIDELNHGHGKHFSHWLRERERDVFLIQKGIGNEPGSLFFLYYNGSLFRIISHDKPDPRNRYGICYTISNIEILNGASSNFCNIVTFLDEALMEEYKIQHANFFHKYSQKITLSENARKQIEGN